MSAPREDAEVESSDSDDGESVSSSLPSISNENLDSLNEDIVIDHINNPEIIDNYNPTSSTDRNDTVAYYPDGDDSGILSDCKEIVIGEKTGTLKRTNGNLVNEAFIESTNNVSAREQEIQNAPAPEKKEEAEAGYLQRARIGCFACRQRCSFEWKKTKAESQTGIQEMHKKAKLCCSWNCLKEYLMDLFPCSKWIPKYRWKHLRGDIAAGVTTGFSIIPQGLAYGQIVEVAAQYGLYASVMGSYAYAVLGTSKHVAVGPSAILSIVTAEYATGRSPVYQDHTYASILAFFTGFILIAMGLLRLGFIFTFISLPVWKAFRAAAGVTIFASRIKKWWGLIGIPRQFLPEVYETLRRMKETNVLDLLFGALFIILLVTFKKLKTLKWKLKFKKMNWKWKIVKKIFWFLGAERNILVVIIGSAIVYALVDKGWNISHTSVIPRGIPMPALPAFTLKVNNTTTIELAQIIQDIGIGFLFTPMLAMYETINVGNTYGKKTNYRIDNNQELIAIGVSNVLSSLIQGHPICGAYLRSGINLGAQVRTPASGIVAASILIMLTFVAHHLFYLIPVSAMAATIMMGAVDVCTFHKFGFLWTINKIELLSWFATFIASLVIGIEYGVFVGVITDLLMMQMVAYFADYNKIEMLENEKSVLIVSPVSRVGLIAPAINNLSFRIEQDIFAPTNPINIIVMDLQRIVNIDSTAINWLIYLKTRCKNNKKDFKIINANEYVFEMLQKSDLNLYLTETSHC